MLYVVKLTAFNYVMNFIFLTVIILMCFIKISNLFECYNCEGNDTNDDILCQNIFFQRSGNSERNKLIRACLNSKDYLCVKTVRTVEDNVYVFRGCQSKVQDKKKLRPGCLFYKSMGYDYQVCLCSDSLCNHSRKLEKCLDKVLYLFLLFYLHRF